MNNNKGDISEIILRSEDTIRIPRKPSKHRDITGLEKECRDFLQGKLADYKIPRFYEKMEALPRNATGKLMKNQLREKERIE